ncbi:type VI secretion protein IcmF/TssM N-terminal domain-containing protein [Pirellulaceae bacterium SH467]
MSGVAEGSDPMDEQPAEVESQDGKPTGCLTRIIPVTTPGCAAALTLVFLITTVVSVWIVFWLDPVNIPWRHGYSWLRIFTILGLIILIPWVVFRTIQAWLEGPRRAFPELDMAWQAGINALAANELTPKNAPLFLIVGSNGEAQERAMMAATGMSFSVQGVPHGPAPIHWYANAEAIYLFCSDSSWTSALASLREELAKEQSTIASDSPIEMSEPGSIPLLPTPTPSTPAPSTPAPLGTPPSGSAPAPRFRGTLEFDSFVAPSSQPLAPAPAATTPIALPSNASASIDSQVPAAPTNYRGTLILNGAGSDPGNAAPSQPEIPSFRETAPADRGPVSIAYSAGVEPSDVQGTRKPVLVSHQYSTACLQELAYLGSLVRKSRQPLCSINGVLTLLQMEAIHGSPVEVEELTKAIRSDLETVQYAFQIRCPVTALIVGLEKERGFRELVRRVGRDRALSQRFGKRFDVQSIPTRTELVSLATLACSAFEDWTYSLFREEQALTKPGNTRLYELLSKVRCNWKSRLSTILSQGFGCEENTRPDGDAILFSGCYFAGTGETADRQAFVKGIVEKLNEEQEFIEWAPSALRSHRLQSALATIGIFVVLGLLLLLLGMFVAFNTGLL